MGRIIRGTIAALGAAALLAACGTKALTGSERVAGTFTLAAVNSAPLPFTLSTSGATSVRITAGSITLTNGGSFVLRETKQTMNGGTVVSTAPDSLAGTFFVTGNNVTLNVTNPATAQYTGTFLNDVLTFDIATNSYRFTR
jgi:uncharacterized Zn-binding protein involved in type VI secretion